MREPETVGTVQGVRPRSGATLDGEGRGGAVGGNELPKLLLLQFSLGRSSLSTNLAAALVLRNLSHSIRTARGAGRGRLRTTRLIGWTLLDFLLRQKVAVEMRTVMATMVAMMPASKPTAFMGLSLVCIRKAAMGSGDSV